MIVGLSHTPLNQNDYSCPANDSLIYVGNDPFRRFEGHIAPSEHYIHTLAGKHHVVVGTDFRSGLELASSVKSAALWIIEVMMPVAGQSEKIINETNLGLGAGRYLSQIVMQNTASPILLLAISQPTSPAILDNLEKELGTRGIAENALLYPPNDFAKLVEEMLQYKTSLI